MGKLIAGDEELRGKVRDAYSAVAADPGGAHAFPAGRAFARSLGYPDRLLAGVPEASVEAFTGVSNISVIAEIGVNMTVADIGCGAGFDTFIAARKTGSGGRVVGIDFSREMLNRAQSSRTAAGLEQVVFCRAEAERLPIAAESVDVALVNGIFNLNPARRAIFKELGRIVKKGGAVYAAELILAHQLPREVLESETNWFA